jgi:hypothetical protein
MDGFSNTNFRTPSNFLEGMKSSISIGENLRHTNKKTHFTVFFFISVFVWRQLCTNSNITFQALQKMRRGLKICIRKTVLFVCFCPNRKFLVTYFKNFFGKSLRIVAEFFLDIKILHQFLLYFSAKTQ